MAYVLPHVGTYADESFTVTLEGNTYKIRMKWNTRDESWTLYIGYSGEDAVMSQKALVGFDLLETYSYRDGVPEGNIYIVDLVKDYGRPTRDGTGAGKRFQLIYIESDEDFSYTGD
jgi:hypothetical protein